MSDLQKMTEAVKAFRDARNWQQFHNPKDMALSLVLEATEVLEHFQWKNGDELKMYVEEHKEEIGDELADVLYWVLMMSHDLGIDLQEAHARKLEKTAKKYPIEKWSGRAGKWSEDV